MMTFLERNNIRIASNQEMNADQTKAAEKLLKGLLIVPTHMDKEKKFKVNRLEKPANKYEFDLVDHNERAAEGANQPPARRITVAQYFKETYNITLRNPKLPCISVGDPRQPICFPMEVCQIAKGLRYNRKLNPTQQANIAKVRILSILLILIEHLLTLYNIERALFFQPMSERERSLRWSAITIMTIDCWPSLESERTIHAKRCFKSRLGF